MSYEKKFDSSNIEKLFILIHLLELIQNKNMSKFVAIASYFY